MTPQQMGLIQSGLDATLKPYLDRKVRAEAYLRLLLDHLRPE